MPSAKWTQPASIAFALAVGLSIGLVLCVGVACEKQGLREEPVLRNVVLISIDDLGARHVSAYGHDRPTTPHFDRFAREGTLFERAYCPQVWTLTSHISMMTGLYPQTHGASERAAARPGATTLAQILAAEGFETAAFTGIGGYMHPKFGLGRGFDQYTVGPYRLEIDQSRTLAWLTEQSEAIESNSDHRFFLFAHYYDVHSDVGTDVPYAAPEPHANRFLDASPKDLGWTRSGDTGLLIELQNQGNASEEDRRIIGALYDGGVNYADEVGLGALLDHLRALDLLETSLVIVTSDHGEEIFEHGKVSHQQPYEETSRVPLAMRGPGIPVDNRIDDAVQLVDLMPTVLSLLSLPIPPHVQGRSLTPLFGDRALRSRDAYVDGLFGGLPHLMRRLPSAITGEREGRRWSYVTTIQERDQPDGARSFESLDAGELYLLDEDPFQLRDVRAEHPDLAKSLRSDLLAWYAENDGHARALDSAGDSANDSPESQDSSLLDAAEIRRLEALGYVR